jgi:hypothetical protein
MIVKPALAAMLASGLIVPEKPALILPKPAIVKAENIEFTKHLLLGMPLTMGMLPGKQKPVSLINRGTTAFVSSSGLTTYTFTSVAIGAASATRRVIILAVGSHSTITGRALVSATIGGVSAAIDVQRTQGLTFSKVSAIISATVPTGTTATVTLTFSAAMTLCSGLATAIDNLVNTAPVTTANAGNSSGTNTCSTAAMSWPAGAYIVGVAGSGSSSATYTWSGSALTEYFDAVAGLTTMSAADLFSVSAASSQVVTITQTTNSVGCLVVAAYR